MQRKIGANMASKTFPTTIKILIYCLAIAQIATAKIADPEPLFECGVIYQSHENYIDAYDSLTGNKKWHSELYESIYPLISIPLLEQDVQWNIISEYTIRNDTIFVKDCKRNTYYVDKRNGNILGKEILEERDYGSIIFLTLIAIMILAILIFARKHFKPSYDDID
jgi:outer membrane protein assembly factor BamB